MDSLLPSFSITNTAAIVGLFSLLIPIIIHIINRSRGRVVYLGTIEFVKKLNRIRVTELKLTRWFLLLIRLIIIIIITLLVSGLSNISIKKTTDNSEIYFTAHWIASHEIKDLVEILQKNKTAKLFTLMEGYPPLETKNFEQIKTKIKKDAVQIHSSAWASELLNRRIQSNKMIVYSTNSTAEFSKQKPSLSNAIDWRFSADSATDNTFQKIAVCIYYAPTRTLDSRVLHAVFEQLKASGYQNYDVMFQKADGSKKCPSTDAPYQWFFWLSDEPVPEKILLEVKLGAFLLTDAPTEERGSQRRLSKSLSNANIAGYHSVFVGLHRDKKITNIFDTVIWSDSLNNQILSYRSLGAGLHYSFNSRFNPAWNTFVENINFPLVISKLLSNKSQELKAKKLSITGLESLTKIESDKRIINDFHKWLVLLMALFWLIERWRSEKRKIS